MDLSAGPRQFQGRETQRIRQGVCTICGSADHWRARCPYNPNRRGGQGGRSREGYHTEDRRLEARQIEIQGERVEEVTNTQAEKA